MAYITVCPLFGEKIFPQITWAAFAIIAFVGALVMTFCTIVLRQVGLSEYFVFIIPVFNLLFLNRKIKFVVRQALDYKVLVHLAIFTILYLNVGIQAFRMGMGDFPSEFYNTDSAAYLSLLQGFVKSSTYPPLNLELVGASFRYHYGSIAFAALLSKVTLLKPHFALLTVIPCFSAAVFYATAYRIAKKVIGTANYWLPVICTVLVVLLINFEINSFRITRILRFVFNIEKYGKQFQMLSNVVAICLCAICLYILLCIESWKQAIGLLCIIPIIGLVKVPFMPIVLGVSGLYLVYLLVTKKASWVYWLLPILVIASAAIVLFFSLGNNMSNVTGRGTNKISIQFNTKILMELVFKLGFLVYPFVLILLNRSITKKPAFALLLCTAIVVFVTGSFFEVDNADYNQVYSNVAVLFVLLIVPLTIYLLHKSNKVIQYSAYTVLILPACIVLFSSFYYTKVLVGQRKNAHEYCNNQSIATALKTIPVSGSILVTNDLRYPANAYMRDNKQFQLSAIFGHQAFASSSYFVTKQTEGTYGTGLNIKRMLQQTIWNDSLNNLFAQHHITHILIHKNYPSPQNIPYDKTFDGAEYTVYQIKK